MAEKLTSNFFGCVNPCNIDWQKFLTDQVKLDKGNVIEKWLLNDMGECDECRVKFSLFKRKKICMQCGLAYCSSCLIRCSGGQRQCNKCTVLSHWPINLDEISSLRVRDLRHFLNAHKIKTDTVREKRDLIELVVLQLKRRHDARNYGHFQNASTAESNNASRRSSSSSSTFTAPSTADDGIRVRPLNTLHTDQSRDVRSSNSVSNLPDEGDPEGIRVFPSSQGQSVAAKPPNLVEPTCDNSDNSSSSAWSLLSEIDTENSPADIVTHSTNLEDPLTIPENNITDSNPTQVQAQESEESVSQPSASPVQPPPVPPPVSQSSSLPNSHLTLASDVVKLGSIETEESIRELSVRQCKEILTMHRVDYSGVWEKHELVNKVKMLWVDYRQRQEEKNVGDEQLCKICMDAVMDCVLLECGHIVSCTDCGKQMSECPICRQNVIRVVKTFRA